MSRPYEHFFQAGGEDHGDYRGASQLVDELYAAQERIDRDEIYRRAVAAALPSDDMAVLDRLPEDELNEAIAPDRQARRLPAER